MEVRTTCLFGRCLWLDPWRTQRQCRIQNGLKIFVTLTVFPISKRQSLSKYDDMIRARKVSLRISWSWFRASILLVFITNVTHNFSTVSAVWIWFGQVHKDPAFSYVMTVMDKHEECNEDQWVDSKFTTCNRSYKKTVLCDARGSTQEILKRKLSIIMESVSSFYEDVLRDHEWITELSVILKDYEILTTVSYDLDVSCVIHWGLWWLGDTWHDSWRKDLRDILSCYLDSNWDFVKRIWSGVCSAVWFCWSVTRSDRRSIALKSSLIQFCSSTVHRTLIVDFRWAMICHHFTNVSFTFRVSIPWHYPLVPNNHECVRSPQLFRTRLRRIESSSSSVVSNNSFSTSEISSPKTTIVLENFPLKFHLRLRSSTFAYAPWTSKNYSTAYTCTRWIPATRCSFCPDCLTDPLIVLRRVLRYPVHDRIIYSQSMTENYRNIMKY